MTKKRENNSKPIFPIVKIAVDGTISMEQRNNHFYSMELHKMCGGIFGMFCIRCTIDKKDYRLCLVSCEETAKVSSMPLNKTASEKYERNIYGDAFIIDERLLS